MIKTLSTVLIQSNRTLFSRHSIPLSFCGKSCGHFDPPPLPPTRAKVAETWARVKTVLVTTILAHPFLSEIGKTLCHSDVIYARSIGALENSFC